MVSRGLGRRVWQIDGIIRAFSPDVSYLSGNELSNEKVRSAALLNIPGPALT
ncbi:MAG: hypothetical protein JWQ71_2744 [Pedosphaera sp.]|nr:hypothetical protein [Pedosphaera sp.]